MLAIISSYPTGASGIRNFFIKNNQADILLDLADSALLEQPEDNLTVAISRAWYNGSYTMAAKPIKSLEIALYNGPILNDGSYSMAIKPMGLKGFKEVWNDSTNRR